MSRFIPIKSLAPPTDQDNPPNLTGTCTGNINMAQREAACFLFSTWLNLFPVVVGGGLGMDLRFDGPVRHVRSLSTG